ncbi:MAG: FtsX-like permease family protein [Gemmatimonadaceae bacterium]
MDPGFVAEGNTAFTVTLPESAYPGVAKQRQFGNELLASLRSVPGVSLAAASFGLPLTDTRFSLSFTVDGRPAPPPTDEPSAQVRVASTDYFRAMGMHLLRGRGVEDRDNLESPQVVVVSQELARRYFPNEDPLGKVLRMGWRREGRELGGTIVGVVGDVKQFGLGVDAIPTMFVAMDQWPMDEMTFVVRSSMSAATLAPMLRSAVHTVDPRLPIFDYTALTAVVDASLAQPRFYLSLLLAFAGAALLLAAVGLYGVIAYAVQQRAREIGVRMALGASSAAVLRMVVREGLAMSAVGVVLGIAGALALTRLLQSLLFGVTPADPVTFAGVSILLTLVAVLASIVPARRAASVDPQLACEVD